MAILCALTFAHARQIQICFTISWATEQTHTVSRAINKQAITHLKVNDFKMFNDNSTSEFQPKLGILKNSFSSVQTVSHVWLCNAMNRSTPGLPVHHQLPEFTQTPCPSSWWCHPAIPSSVAPFSSCPQSLPASGSFPMSQLFARGGRSIGVSASASVLPMNTQDWSPLGWTGWISLQSKGLSRVFSNTTVQKHQFFRYI